MMFPAMHLVPLGVCLAAATYLDLFKRRIPNLVTGATALSGIVVQTIDRGALAMAAGLAAAAIVILVLYRPWMSGGVGGGDVKLAGAVAVWVGLNGLVWYALSVAVAGGAVALGSYLLSAKAVRREVRANLSMAMLETAAAGAPALPRVPVKAPGRMSVPYGLAIAAGAVVAFWRS